MSMHRISLAALRGLGVSQCRRSSRSTALSLSFSSSARRSSVPMPFITEVTAGGWRTSDIFTKILQDRIIYLSGVVDDSLSASIVAQLLWLESDSPEKPITMYINSPGGEVTSGLAIYDTMRYIRSPVSTLCVGRAASMAAILLLGGEAGKRFALPHSEIMLHQPLGGTRGQAADITIYSRQIERVRDQIDAIVRRHLNGRFGYEKYDVKAIREMMDRDRYFAAEEAKDAGIVDEIMYERTKKDEKKEK